MDGQYVWCGEPGPRLDAPGAPGGRAPLREQPAWGALGKAEQWGGGGRRGLRARPLCVLGNARERQLQPALEVARLHASRHPGGRSRTSPTGRGGRSTAWTGGREPRGRVPPPPAGTPAGLGCVAQGSGGAASPLKWQRNHCVFQPASLQLLGAKEGWFPDGLPKNERSRGRF